MTDVEARLLISDLTPSLVPSFTLVQHPPNPRSVGVAQPAARAWNAMASGTVVHGMARTITLGPPPRHPAFGSSKLVPVYSVLVVRQALIAMPLVAFLRTLVANQQPGRPVK